MTAAATSCGGGIIYKYITNSVSDILTWVIYMQCTFICLADIIKSTFFIYKPLFQSSERNLPSLPIFFFWTVSRQYGAASLTSPACLYCLELYLDRLFPVYQQGFFLSAGLFRKIWVLSSPEFQVVLSVLNSSFWTHETWLVHNHCQMHSIQTIKV